MILHGTKLDLIYLDRPICWQLLCAPSDDVYNRPILASPPHLQEALGPVGEGLGSTEKNTSREPAQTRLPICCRALSIPDLGDEGNTGQKT